MAKSSDDRKMPFWQTEPCASWCSNYHRDSDHPADRRHMSRWSGKTTLTLMEPMVINRADEGEYTEPVEFEVYISQMHREAEAHLIVMIQNLNGRLDIEADVTLQEARRIRRQLDKAIRLAESA